MKGHIQREMVNELVTISKNFHAAEQLRARIADCVGDHLEIDDNYTKSKINPREYDTWRKIKDFPYYLVSEDEPLTVDLWLSSNRRATDALVKTFITQHEGEYKCFRYKVFNNDGSEIIEKITHFRIISPPKI